VSAKEFDEDFYKFRTLISDLEQRLGALITAAFDDCTTLQLCFKLLDAFEGLTDRAAIQTDLEKKHPVLLRTYHMDLLHVQEIFVHGMADPPVYANMAPHSGAVAWARGLLERADEPMARLKGVVKAALDTQEGKEIVRTYSALISSLQEFEKSTVERWCLTIDAISSDKLNRPLLRREEQSRRLLVNFDAELTCLLREVRYFILLHIEVPASAMSVYKNIEYFRQNVGNLEVIATIYNRIVATLLAVERPLLEERLEEIDQVLQRGLHELCWNTDGIADFINETMSKVQMASTILVTLKANVERVQKILSDNVEKVLMDRKPGKTYRQEEFSALMDAHIQVRYEEIEEGSEQIHKLMEHSNTAVNVPPTNAAWKQYIDYVNTIMIEGLADVIAHSQLHLQNQLDEKWMISHDTVPLLELQLELTGLEIRFDPEIGSEQGGGNSIRGMVQHWLDGFMNVGTLCRRLDTGDGDYLTDLQEALNVRLLTFRIHRLVDESERRCNEFRQLFKKYEYLWLSVCDLTSSCQMTFCMANRSRLPLMCSCPCSCRTTRPSSTSFSRRTRTPSQNWAASTSRSKSTAAATSACDCARPGPQQACGKMRRVRP
jgi:dynein heavy chain